jgi:hypothetical protein
MRVKLEMMMMMMRRRRRRRRERTEGQRVCHFPYVAHKGHEVAREVELPPLVKL